MAQIRRCDPKSCQRRVDMRDIVRTHISRRLVEEFRGGISIRVLVQRYGLNADGVQGLIHSHGDARMNELDLFDRPSTADTGDRSPLDLYETPAWMIASLLAHHPIDRASVILEPCCGAGSIVRALQASGCRRIITNDLDERHEATRHRDATSLLFWEMETIAHVDWVITNPPFACAMPILEQACLVAKVGVAFLLRKTFLEPTERRGPWLSMHPPTNMIGLPRHSFRGTGSDSVSTDWYIWRKHPEQYVAPPFVIDYVAESRRIG